MAFPQFAKLWILVDFTVRKSFRTGKSTLAACRT